MSIIPKQININDLFGNVKYYIDFYQREYKWKKDHVISLLEDIFYRFEMDYDSKIDATPENISKFNWYYLNSFMTNTYDGRQYIVDGQQRLTTITLIIIKLYHMAQHFSDKPLTQVLERKIFGADLSGSTFWMGQDGRAKILQCLVDGQINGIDNQNISYCNMLGNYNEISDYLDVKIDCDHKFKCFVIYFLKLIMLVGIDVDNTKDVPMVFEVINDRGEKLRSYEVFKGQTMGQLAKDDIHNTYHPIWKNCIEPIELISDDEVDNFFRYYFKAKYADSAHHHRQFDGEYHRAVFSKDWDSLIQLKHNIVAIKRFISEELNYYTKLYLKLLDKEIYDKSHGENVYYNSLNEQDRQFMLIMSACTLNDPDENEKIILISKLLDRHFTILQLYGCYDSNVFGEILFDLNREIRGQSLANIQSIFDKRLFSDISEIKNTTITDIFDYTFFKNAGTNLAIRFIRYFFARVENFIATEINPNHRLTRNQLWDLVRNTGAKTGYHIEHILANNDENETLFGNDLEFFQRERNRLGGLLLLKGRDNISSNNEVYKKKLATYNNADISNRWNRSLIESFYHTNKEFHDFIKRESLPFKHYDVFDATAVEERHQLLFELAKRIWC